ncbi:MAG: hypothetical protein ABIH87_03365 [bacterium]
MQFTDKQLDSFIALYKKEFGDELSKGEALQKATSLVSMVKLTYVPMTEKDFKESMEACIKSQKTQIN